MSWILKLLSKKQLLSLLWRILRKVFGRVYEDAARLVVKAQLNGELKTGLERAQWVAQHLLGKYDELSEWRWVVNLIIEGAVSEYKRDFRPLELLRFG